jgi:hypothetical protein
MLKRLRVFVVFLFTLALVACGSAPTTTPQPNPTDKTPPTLTASVPANGSSTVPINVKLGFTFSEAMDEGSLELSSTPPLSFGNPTWNASTTGVAFDNAALAASTPYTLMLKAKDISGNALAETTLSFTTSSTADTTAPSTPTGLVATPANGQVTLTWQASPETDVAGYTVYVGTSQDALEPKDFVTTTSKTFTGLTNGTTYFFTVDAVDTAANKSNKTTPVSATPSTTVTDTTPPKIQSSDPADGATGVSPRQTSLRVQFSEPMNKTSFEFAITPRFGASDAPPNEPFNVTWSDNDTVVTLQPALSNLVAENTTFKLTLFAKDRAGNALSGDNEITFTTREEPRLVSSTPANGSTDIPVEKFEIKLVFSKAMDTATFKVEPTLEPLDIPFYSQSWTLTWSADDTVLILTTAIDPGYFLEDTTYTLLLTGADKTGIPLADTTVTFTTVDDPTPPTIVQTSPADDMTEVPLSPLDVFIYFDDVMDVPTTLAALSSSPALACEWQQFFDYSANDKSLKSAFACRSETKTFEPSTTYTITVSTTAKDSSGNNLYIGKCIADPNDPPCAYSFKFSTLTPPPPTGTLKLDISGLPLGQNKVRITGASFDSGLLDSSNTFSGLAVGDYTVSAASFAVAPGKPACRIYTPTPESQTVSVTTGQTTTATVTYESESCAAPPNEP